MSKLGLKKAAKGLSFCKVSASMDIHSARGFMLLSVLFGALTTVILMFLIASPDWILLIAACLSAGCTYSCYRLSFQWLQHAVNQLDL